MKFFYLVLFSASMLVGTSCGTPEAESTPTTPAAAAAAAPDETTLLSRLSAELPTDTSTLLARDQYRIINHAIDELIDLRQSPTGLAYRIAHPGEGERIAWGDELSVHYRGELLDGTLFDSSYGRDAPIKFYVGNMIDGWNEGLQLIAPGGRIELWLPSPLAYGAEGLIDGNNDTLVPPNTILHFKLEVMERLSRTDYSNQ